MALIEEQHTDNDDDETYISLSVGYLWIYDSRFVDSTTQIHEIQAKRIVKGNKNWTKNWKHIRRAAAKVIIIKTEKQKLKTKKIEMFNVCAFALYTRSSFQLFFVCEMAWYMRSQWHLVLVTTITFVDLISDERMMRHGGDDVKGERLIEWMSISFSLCVRRDKLRFRTELNNNRLHSAADHIIVTAQWSLASVCIQQNALQPTHWSVCLTDCD